MKLGKAVVTPVAAAVAIGLMSSAHAASLPAPAQSSAAPVGGTLYLAVWNDGTTSTDLINLSYNYSQISAVDGTIGSGANALTAGGAPFTPATVLGQSVEQLDFGTISNFSTVQNNLFSSGNIGTTEYMVLAGETSSLGLDMTSALGSTYKGVGLTKEVAGADQALSAWATDGVTPNSPLYDTTGAQVYSAMGASSTLTDGTLSEAGGQNAAGLVGSALGFYQYSRTSARTAIEAATFENSSGQQGFWLLSATGDLTWNVPLQAAPVPLPAALWLLASGLAGLGAIGRRRGQKVQAA